MERIKLRLKERQTWYPGQTFLPLATRSDLVTLLG
jgi:hypothetical protein